MKIIKKQINDLLTKELQKITSKIGDGLHGTPKYTDNGDYYFINGNNLSGIIKFNGNDKKVSKIEFDKYKKPIDLNTIFFSINGTIGHISKYKNEKIVLSKSVCYINPINNVLDSTFLYYYLKNNNIKNQIERNSNEAVIKNVSLRTMRELRIKLPNSFKKQQQIATVLSQQEEQVNKIKTLIEKLEKRNQYYAERLLSGELRVREGDNGKVEFYENTEWKEIYINGKNKFIPENWCYSKISEYMIDNKKSSFAAKDSNINGIYPFYNCSKKQKLFINKENMRLPSILLSTGGVAAVHYAEYDRYAYSSDVYSFNIKEINEKFISYYLKNKISEIDSYFQGAAIKHLSKRQFKNMFIPIIKNNECLLINKALDLMFKEEEDIRKLLEKEQKRFDWMSDALLSGEYQIVD